MYLHLIVTFQSVCVTVCLFVCFFIFFLQAMLDVAANEGWLVSALSICNLVQMIVQARWLHDSSLLTLPHIDQRNLYLFRCVDSCLPRNSRS